MFCSNSQNIHLLIAYRLHKCMGLTCNHSWDVGRHLPRGEPLCTRNPLLSSSSRSGPARNRSSASKSTIQARMKKQIFIFELKQNETQILFTFFSDMAAYGDSTTISERKREIDWEPVWSEILFYDRGWRRLTPCVCFQFGQWDWASWYKYM